MATIYANYESLSLSGATKTLFDLGDGYTASTVHKIHCVIAGSVTIAPMIGPSFIWVAAVNDEIEIVPSSVTVTSGHFIGFRAKHVPIQFFNFNS